METPRRSGELAAELAGQGRLLHPQVTPQLDKLLLRNLARKRLHGSVG